MIRRWIRALVRTGSPGHPFPVPPKAGRHPRTLLRLEAVEDRTLASVTAVEPPKPVPAPTEAHVGTASDSPTPTPSDDQSQAITDGATAPTTDGNSGPGDASSWHQFDGRVLTASDVPVSLTAEVAAAMPATFSGQVARHQTTLDDRLPGETDHADESAGRSQSRGGGQTGPSGTALGTEVNGTGGMSEASQPSPERSAAPAGRGSSEPAADAAYAATVTAGQPIRRSADANGPPARQVTVDVDPAGPRANRGGPSTPAGATPATRPPSRPLPADLSDGALLQRFVANREEAAFTALVRRYAPVVLGVCQRVLGDYHAAQDASQATFVVLARKAGMLDRTSPLGGWLYKVAYHLALRSRGTAARQKLGEWAAALDDSPAPAAADDGTDLEQREVNQVLREELQGLPEKYRAPLALVYIDGRSHADAAQAIGLPRGSMAKRVGEGLDRLRERLEHRGISL